jgi:zinc protease
VTKQRETLPVEWSAARLPTKAAALDNGLTVVAHRDSKAALVAVYVAYHVGSRDEAPGKAGLAHLAEHLMFAGTRTFPGNLFGYFEPLGATSINAISREDYTAYFEAVPRDAVDQVVAIEAERMDASAATFDEFDLDRQRDVVRSELLQREAEAYGSADRLIAQNAYPAGHPYHHPPNGLIDELDKLSMFDATGWFAQHYGPANATLVIAGDIEPEAAIDLARRRFGSIAPGSSMPRQRPVIATLEKERRVVIDSAGPSRVYMVWNVPEFGSPEHAGFELLAEIIAGGVNSRIGRQLIQKLGLASAVCAEFRARELGSQLVIHATNRDRTHCAALEEEMRAEVRRICDSGPTIGEVKLARFRCYARLIRNSERLCGPRSKSETLALGASRVGDAQLHEKRLARIASIRPSELRELARIWLDDRVLILHFESSTTPSQFQLLQVTENHQERHTQRSTKKAALALASKDLPIVAVSRAGSPLFEFRLISDGGCAQDPPGKSGLAGVAVAALLDLEAPFGSASASFKRLGAQIEGRVRLDASVVGMSALTSNLSGALDLFATTVATRRVREDTVERAKTSRIALIHREKARPLDLALRTLPVLVFGKSHPYSRPATGSGSAEEIATISTADVEVFYSRLRSLKLLHLIALGPLAKRQLKDMAERISSRSPSTARATSPRPIPSAERSRDPKVVLHDAPGRSQSAVFCALATIPRNSPDFEALMVADALLGGSFASRLNLNLREAKGWCYGARTILLNGRDAGLWIAYAFVEHDRTAAAMSEIRRELRGLIEDRPVTPHELDLTTRYLIRRMPSESETNAQIADSIEEEIIYGLSRSDAKDRPARLRALCTKEITATCRAIIDEHPASWLVVGDAARIAPAIGSEGFGVPEVIADAASIP